MIQHDLGLIQPDGELIVRMSGILKKVSANEILGLEKLTKRVAMVKNRRPYRQLQDIAKLPKRDQDALFRTIDAFPSMVS